MPKTFRFIGDYETNVELPDGSVRLTQPGEFTDLDFDDPGPLWEPYKPTKAEQAAADKAKAEADKAAAAAEEAAAAALLANTAPALTPTTPAAPAATESEQKS